jgi:hypothetical protein
VLLVRVVKDLEDQAAMVQVVMDNLVPMELQVVMVLLDQEAVVKVVMDRLMSMDHLKK